ncbi:hypothetical protein AVEN_176390-1 [Araneus ventricosus]|uniref:Uncharacterized protein n=1 Tax=Araneus ventricosus TaxID=182803 RepID=A0A4Y2C7Y0_ARAVE|nr:hypothetical protein AVEN_176390-1 [Araneus ventricosus]
MSCRTALANEVAVLSETPYRSHSITKNPDDKAAFSFIRILNNWLQVALEKFEMSCFQLPLCLANPDGKVPCSQYMKMRTENAIFSLLQNPPVDG